FTNAESIYKLHVDWNDISTSTFTGPFITIAPTSWASPPGTVPSQGGNTLDTLAVRLMMQNQYTKLGGVESLWTSHTVRGGSSTQSAVRYYQVDVTGGSVAANTTQSATHNPDSTNRFMPSVAVDRAGDMALGYSTSSSTLFPAIKYAGRLSSDPAGTLPRTEVSLFDGTGTQSGNCGGSPCHRWGDYSAMSLDPDGCTFWYTNEYYATTGLNDLTRNGSFRFPSCTTAASGSVQGTVTAVAGGAPIAGATVALGSRTTTTNGSGFYSLPAIPSGTYPTLSASAPGFNAASTPDIVVTDGNTTVQDFALTAAPATGCFPRATQADFLAGIPNNTDLTSNPGSVILLKPLSVDQHADDNGFGTGYIFTSTSLVGQTFTAGAGGPLTKVEAYVFCAGCVDPNPNMTLELRTTSGGLPVMTAGGLLASSTIPGTSSGSGGFFTFA